MGGLFIPLFFIVVSIGVFFTYVDATYEKTKTLEAESARIDQALTKAKELQEVRNALISRYNTFTRTDIDRLQKLLPDHIDNVRLIIDIDSIAATYRLALRDFGFSDNKESTNTSTSVPGGTNTQSGAARPPQSANTPASTAIIDKSPSSSENMPPYGSVLMDFSVTATYTDFLAFLRDLERSLRLVDVVNITVATTETNLYSYTVTIRTYWMH